MSRSDAERSEDIRAAISRCLAYRVHLDSAELGSMAASIAGLRKW